MTPLTTDELWDLANCLDLAMHSYSQADHEKLSAQYRPGTTGHARLVALLPRLVELTEA